MRQIAGELRTKARGIQAVERNVERILANIKMLELNISDVKELV
jgi:prefoldin subunit 5